MVYDKMVVKVKGGVIVGNGIIIRELELGEVITSGDREYTRLIGGFKEGQSIISTMQISELMGFELRVVNQTIERNMESFEDGLDIIDLKEIITDRDHLLGMGYSKVAVGRASSKFHGLSQSRFLLYLKFAEGDKAIELYKGFIEDYFKTKYDNKELENTLQEQIDFLTEEKVTSLGRMFIEPSEGKKMEYMNDIERINGQLIKLQSKKDNEKIDIALNEQSKLTETKMEYVNQTNFGTCFNLRIGSVMVGKLLQIVGLAYKSSGKTTPYAKDIPRYATSYINQEQSVPMYKWNYSTCVVKIDEFLRNNNYYEDSYTLIDIPKRNKFINMMYEKHVG